MEMLIELDNRAERGQFMHVIHGAGATAEELQRHGSDEEWIQSSGGGRLLDATYYRVSGVSEADLWGVTQDMGKKMGNKWSEGYPEWRCLDTRTAPTFPA